MVTPMFLKIIIILKCAYKISSLGYSVIAVQTANTGRYIVSNRSLKRFP